MKKQITETISVEICEDINTFTHNLNSAKSKLTELGLSNITLQPFYQDDSDDEIEEHTAFYIEVTGAREETDIEYATRLEEEKKARLDRIISTPKTLTEVEISISKEIKKLITENKTAKTIQLELLIQDRCNLLEAIRNKRERFEKVIKTQDENLILSLENEMNNSYSVEGRLI